jgi:polyhydroxyalkanoate synthesis regulator phasin
MKRFTKTMFLFGLGVAAGTAIHKNRDKLKKEIDRMVKQGKIKASEGKAIAADLTKAAKVKAKEKQKEMERKVEAEVKKRVAKLKKKLEPKKKTKAKKVVKKAKNKVKKKK